MSKKVLVISSSLRNRSNSELLSMAFAEGARKAGNEVEEITLRDKTINFCKGCLACQKTLKCVLQDDASEICKKVGEAEVLVFATPIYYYCVSGSLKTMLDRCNPLFPAEYSFRDVYLLMTAADDADEAQDGAVKAMQGWVDCFENASLKGTFFAGGVTDAGSIQGSDMLKKAFALGEAIH